MFESIIFTTQNNNTPTNPIDIGSLVECMLFYKKVSIDSNYSILKQLLKYFGVDRLNELIDEEILEIMYSDSFIRIITDTRNNIQYHDPCKFSSPNITYFDQINKVFFEVYEKRGKAKRLANIIRDKIRITKNDNIILESARESILDQDFIRFSACELIKEYVPEISNVGDIKFNTYKTSEGIVVDSNLDYDSINKLYHKRISPKLSSLSMAFIISQLLHAERDIYIASSRLSELSSSGLNSKIIGYKINYILTRSKKSEKTLENFTSFLFKDSKALRNAVNSNQVDIDELMKVLKKATRFKKWLIGVDPDEDLLKRYYREVTKETIVDKLPGKSTRWAIFTGLGLVTDLIATGGIATVGGLTLGALDTFCLDKLISGWRPNQFIEDEVKKLLN